MVYDFDIMFDKAESCIQKLDFKAARSIYEKILGIEPDNARALHALGVVSYRGWGESRRAVRLIRRALELKSDFAGACNNLGKILQESRRVNAAIACYRRAASIEPDNHLVWINLGTAYSLAKKPEEALTAFQDAIRLAPDSFDAMMGIGRALIEMKHYRESLEYFGKAQELAPDEAVVYYSAALAHKQLNQFAHARTKLMWALELKPDYADAYRGLADVLLSLGDADGSVKAVRKALALKPNFQDAHSLLLYALHYRTTCTQQELYRDTVAWCERYCGNIPRFTDHSNDRTPGRPLRVGYISGEFNRHPVGFFIEQALAYHDSATIIVYCYSNGPVTDWLTERLKGYDVVWRDIAVLCDEKVTSLIRQDAIDILVDLSGHTGAGRLHVMARNPAPVQVSWIGYYNTTGLDTIDYILMDAHTVPEGMVQWFTERVVYLPETRFCYTPPPDSFEVKPPPALQNGFVTFGCFNNISKISRNTIKVWSTILTCLPDARLILKWGTFSDSGVVERFLGMFAERGIAPHRVEYRESSDYGTMLDEYGDIDIALDPFPFSGATTTCEALWMGVPVITLPGSLPVSRQTMALLKVIGLPEFIADSEDAYVELAIYYAGDLDALAALRQRQRGVMAMSPLCDGRRFTAELESAYQEMWRRWCEGMNNEGDRRPIEILPVVPEAVYNRGVACISENRWHEARYLLEKALTLNPEFPEAMNNMGIVLYHLGELEEADAWLAKAATIRPGFVAAFNNRGKVLTSLQRWRDAESMFSKVLSLDPSHPQAWNNLGELHLNSGRIARARACFRKALRHQPDFPDALNNLAALYMQYDAEEGYRTYEKLIKLHPEEANVHQNLIFAMHYSDRFSREDIFRRTCQWGDIFYNSAKSAQGVSLMPNETGGQKPLRVGFVSADFHQHPGGVFFQALARHHDRSQYSFICYDNSGKRDLITDEIRRQVEGWRCVAGTTDDEFIDLIRSDGVEILIDLSGFTAGHRLSVFARKPAPMQASWLGWFNTTGLKAIDYLIVDPLMVRDGEERLFVEKMAYLPQGRFCYTSPFLCPEVEELPALNNGYITFGCFNNLAKITDRVVVVWGRILRRLPDSRLVLKSPYFKDYEMRRRFQKRFEVHGVSADRLDLRPNSPHFYMMTEYEDIDIALDPFPYCGGLTSCEALWMGVPVITLTGDLPVSRQTESFLQVVGLPEYISRGEQEYVELACDRAGELEQLRTVRAGLRDRMAASSLCDGARFATAFQDVLNKIWLDRQAGYEVVM